MTGMDVERGANVDMADDEKSRWTMGGWMSGCGGLGMSARVLCLVALLIMGGCAQLPHESVVPEAQPISYPDPSLATPNGAIYQARGGFHPLFQDRRPRQVGDIITITINEDVSASKDSSSNANRESSLGLDLETIPDLMSFLEDNSLDVSGENDFEGSGGSSASNTFTGTLTATVVNILPNGNLQVRGEKRIAINQGTEYIRFSGVVDPLSVTTQNTVPSGQVADARIEYVGDGYINEAQHMGWLQRLWLNIAPF